jgi:predicted NBD/HSP70 family sugar kinase
MQSYLCKHIFVKSPSFATSRSSGSASTTGTPLLGVGLGVPGVVDPARGTLNSPMLGWRDLRLGAALQRRLGVPVLVDNDVNTLAVFERLYGRGRAVESFATVTLGRGVGLGLILNGDIYRGYAGGAGEFGHVTAVPDGPVCSCGKRGCLEAVVADPALVAEARRRSTIPRRAGIERLRSLADAGDAGAIELFGSAGGILGRSIADLVNILSPQLVLISGEGSESWRHLSDRFELSFRTHLFPPLRGVTVEIDPWDDAK